MMDELVDAVIRELESVDFTLLGLGKKILNWEDPGQMSPHTREVLQKIGFLEQGIDDLVRSIRRYYRRA